MEIILIYYTQWPHWPLCRLEKLTCIAFILGTLTLFHSHSSHSESTTGRCLHFLVTIRVAIAMDVVRSSVQCNRSKSHRVANVRCRFHKALLLIFNSNWRGSIAWTQPIHSSLSLSFSSTLHLTESHSKWLILSPNISQFFAHTLGYEPIWIVDFRSHFIILTLSLPSLGRLSSTKCWIYRFLVRISNVCLVYCSKCEAEYKYL